MNIKHKRLFLPLLVSMLAQLGDIEEPPTTSEFPEFPLDDPPKLDVEQMYSDVKVNRHERRKQKALARKRNHGIKAH